MTRGRFFASEAAAPSAVIILKKIDMDRIEIVNKYCGGGTLPKVITEPSPDHIGLTYAVVYKMWKDL